MATETSNDAPFVEDQREIDHDPGAVVGHDPGEGLLDVRGRADVQPPGQPDQADPVCRLLHLDSDPACHGDEPPR